MGKFIKLLLVLVLSILVLSGCSKEDEPFIIPVNYTGEAQVKVYTDNSENNYDIKILSRDGNYSFAIDTDSASWNVSFLADKRCVLGNEKFPESSVTINDFNIAKSLITDFDLNKFNLLDPIPEELIYWDGNYKHVLNFNTENLLPDNINIYKNDILVKTIKYNKISTQQ